MNVDQYMQPGVTTLPPDAPLSVARDTMDAHGFGLLLIATAEAQLTGFITRAGLKDVKDWDVAVEKLAHPVKFSVASDDTLEKAALIMLANRLVVLPVVDDGQLIGVITQAELLKGLTVGLGIGMKATRFTATVRKDSTDVFRMLDVVRQHGARLLSVVQGKSNDTHSEIILRVQDVDDKDALRADLETALRDSEAT
ncbi:CBS domain-containing protein [Candidatus Bipolaricaulota bacterium]|nr:CBS domain-containing protein [Candidatus Bipolaricaulota bacterium]TFH11765.1 MAG: CBS domain-containing protein [Candidatus Atribacteria bacterium]